MPAQFNGKIELDVRDSTPDWEPFLAPRGPVLAVAMAKQ